jgi:hypothetical protein
MAIEPAPRLDAVVALFRFASEDVTYLPFYYEVAVRAVRTGLTGVIPAFRHGESSSAFNVHEWELRP